MGRKAVAEMVGQVIETSRSPTKDTNRYCATVKIRGHEHMMYVYTEEPLNLYQVVRVTFSTGN